MLPVAGTRVTQPGLVLTYAGTPGPGRLVRSEADIEGADEYGNSYPAGRHDHEAIVPLRADPYVWMETEQIGPFVRGPRILPVAPRTREARPAGHWPWCQADCPQPAVDAAAAWAWVGAGVRSVLQVTAMVAMITGHIGVLLVIFPVLLAAAVADLVR